MPSKGAGNSLSLYALGTAPTIGSLIYTFENIETSSHTTQASGLHDFNLTDRAYDKLLAAFYAAALPKDPSAGGTAETLEPLENNTGGGSVSLSATQYLAIYIGPYDGAEDEYETIAELVRLEVSSKDLAATKANTTNRTNPKLIGQKPEATWAVLAAHYPIVTAAATTNLTASNLALDGPSFWYPAA